MTILGGEEIDGVSEINVQILDTSVDNALIDNANYSYFAFCEVPSSTSAAGIYGANIEYTVSALKGAAS